MRILSIVIVSVALMALLGCVNSDFSFDPALGVNLSLYNRGGTVSAPAAHGPGDQATDSLIETEGGGEVEVTPPAAVGTDILSAGK